MFGVREMLDGASLSTLMPPIGPATAQLPARSQTSRLSVAASAVSTSVGTAVVRVKVSVAAPSGANPPSSVAVQSIWTSVACQSPSGWPQAIVGGVVSDATTNPTVTTKAPAAWLPASSVATQETVVSSRGKWLPDAGSQTTGTAPSTTSSAVEAN